MLRIGRLLLKQPMLFRIEFIIKNNREKITCRELLCLLESKSISVETEDDPSLLDE